MPIPGGTIPGDGPAPVMPATAPLAIGAAMVAQDTGGTGEVITAWTARPVLQAPATAGTLNQVAVWDGSGNLEARPVTIDETATVRLISPTYGARSLYVTAGQVLTTDGRFMALNGLQVASSGPILKNSSGTVAVRNAADTAAAPISASAATISGTVVAGGFNDGLTHQIGALRVTNRGTNITELGMVNQPYGPVFAIAMAIENQPRAVRVRSDGGYGWVSSTDLAATLDTQLKRVSAGTVGVYAADGTTLGGMQLGTTLRIGDAVDNLTITSGDITQVSQYGDRWRIFGNASYQLGMPANFDGGGIEIGIGGGRSAIVGGGQGVGYLSFFTGTDYSAPKMVLDNLGNLATVGDFYTKSSPLIYPSAANSNLNMSLVPTGTATQTAYSLFGSSDIPNGPYAQLAHVGSEARLNSGANGTGIIGDLAVYVNGERARFLAAGGTQFTGALSATGIISNPWNELTATDTPFVDSSVWRAAAGRHAVIAADSDPTNKYAAVKTDGTFVTSGAATFNGATAVVSATDDVGLSITGPSNVTTLLPRGDLKHTYSTENRYCLTSNAFVGAGILGNDAGALALGGGNVVGGANHGVIAGGAGGSRGDVWIYGGSNLTAPSVMFKAAGSTTFAGNVSVLVDTIYPNIVLGRSAVRQVGMTWDDLVGEGLFQTYDRSFPIAFDGSYSRFLAGGVQKMRVDSNGVGIGGTPNAPLHVINDSNRGVRLSNSSGLADWEIFVNGFDIFGLYNVTTAMTRVTVTPAGNVRLGGAHTTGNAGLIIDDLTSTFSSGYGGQIVFAGDDRGQGIGAVPWASVRGVKENNTYLDRKGALVFLVSPNAGPLDGSIGSVTELEEAGRFTSAKSLEVLGAISAAGQYVTVGSAADTRWNRTGAGAFDLETYYAAGLAWQQGYRQAASAGGVMCAFFGGAPVLQPAALTAAIADVATSSDAAIVDNLRTRVNEIESRLTDLHLIAA